MAVNIGPRIQVEGEKEYRAQLNNIIQQAKTLNSEMRTMTEGYDSNTSATKRATEQTKLINEQIRVQQKRIDELGKGLQMSAEKFGENDTRTLQWRETLNNAAIEMERLKKEAVAAAQQIGTAIQEAGTKISAAGEKISSAGKKLTTAVTLPLIAAGTAAAKAASDYEENINKIDVAFGDSADEVKAWAKTATEQFGLSENAALEATAQFGDMATSMGISKKSAASMSTQLAGLAGDLASFKNISTDEAMTALNSIFTGETESLKKLGIVMTEVNLKQFAEDTGLVYSEMSQAEKVTLRYNYVLDKTKNAQGDYARTSDGAANSLRTLMSSAENLAIEFGQVVLPTATKLIKKATEIIKAVGKLDPATKEMIVKGAALLAVIGPLTTGTGKLVSAVGKGVQIYGKAASKLLEMAAAKDAAAVAAGGLATRVGMLSEVIGALPALGIAVAGALGLGLLAKATSQATEINIRMTELEEKSKSLKETLEDSSRSLSANMETARGTIDNAVASAAVADQVAGELEALANKTTRTADEQERMEFLVGELNELFPEMGLAIDDVTGNLNMSTEAIKDFVEAAKNAAKVEAYNKAIETAYEGIVDAGIEAAKAEKDYQDLVDMRDAVKADIDAVTKAIDKNAEAEKDLQKQYRDGKITYDTYTTKVEELQSGYIEYNGTLWKTSELQDQLSNQLIDANQKVTAAEKTINSANQTVTAATEEMALLQDGLEKAEQALGNYDATATAATGTLENQNAALDNTSTKIRSLEWAYAGLSETGKTEMAKFVESAQQMETSLQGSIEHSMGLFDTFDGGVATSIENISAALDSQIAGVEQWEADLNTLMDMGINQDLLQTLIDAGPSTATYARALVEGGADALSEINTKWDKKQDIINLANNSGKQLKETAVKSIADSTPVIKAAYSRAGMDSWVGFVEGMKGQSEAVETANTEVAEAGISAAEDVLDINSPSKRYKAIGSYAIQGLTGGLLEGLLLVKAAVQRVMEAAVFAPDMSAARSAGRNLSAGLAAGILDGRNIVTSAITQVADAAVKSARKKLEIHSPSKVFGKIGNMSMQGFAKGIQAKIKTVRGIVTQAMDFTDFAAAFGPGSGMMFDAESMYQAARAGVRDGQIQPQVVISEKSFKRALVDMGVVME